MDRGKREEINQKEISQKSKGLKAVDDFLSVTMSVVEGKGTRKLISKQLSRHVKSQKEKKLLVSIFNCNQQLRIKNTFWGNNNFV